MEHFFWFTVKVIRYFLRHHFVVGWNWTSLRGWRKTTTCCVHNCLLIWVSVHFFSLDEQRKMSRRREGKSKEVLEKGPSNDKALSTHQRKGNLWFCSTKWHLGVGTIIQSNPNQSPFPTTPIYCIASFFENDIHNKLRNFYFFFPPFDNKTIGNIQIRLSRFPYQSRPLTPKN